MTAVARTVDDGEPISPELALVCPELRALGLAALEHRDEQESFADLWRLAAEAETGDEAVAPPPRRLSVQLALYAAVQVAIGLLVGAAAVAAVTVALLGLTLVTR